MSVNLTNPTALELALILLVPGFISMKVYDVLVPSVRREISAASLDVLAYGSINFALLALPLLALNLVGKLQQWAIVHPVIGYGAFAAGFFVLPALWPIGLVALLKSNTLKPWVRDPTPKPWDYVFGKGIGYWVILHMKDGRRIGGRYDTESFASSFPNDEQLYLQEVWELDQSGSFKRMIPQSRGIIVASRDLFAIEFFLTQEEKKP